MGVHFAGDEDGLELAGPPDYSADASFTISLWFTKTVRCLPRAKQKRVSTPTPLRLPLRWRIRKHHAMP